MKHQQEMYNLTNDSQKALSTKMAEFEEKIKTIEVNNKKLIEERENTIKENNKQIHNLNSTVNNLEHQVSGFKTESAEKSKKISLLEQELSEANKNANGLKSKYEALSDKLEKEFQIRTVNLNYLIIKYYFSIRGILKKASKKKQMNLKKSI